ncbi:oligosaccharide repeat unit polymerase [Bacteroidaceae bacterium HV4-6-C5C]|nr:oligosaccharide repeat unit polymerase [Bacteroidaceae bacterium HV4-6-C5C]
MSIFIVMPLNFLLYFGSFISTYRKNGLSIASFVWLIYSIFAAFSIYLCLSGLYWKVMYSSVYEYEPISPIPLLLNYLCVYFILKPLDKIQLSKLNFSCLVYSRRNWNIIYVLFAIDIIYALIKIMQLKTAISFGFGNLHDMGGEYISTLYYEGNPLAKLFNALGRFSNIMIVPFVLLYIFKGYKNGKCSKKILIFYFFVFIFNALSIGLTTGSRANLFFGLLNLSFFFLLFWSDLSKKTKKRILFGVIIIVTMLIVVTTQITKERFDDNLKRTAMDSVFEYLGETFPVLGYEYWNKAEYTGGQRLFSDFFSLFDNNFIPKDSDYWYHYTGVRLDWFKTIYGDLYIEFGPILPVIILFILAISFTAYLRSGSGVSCQRISVIYRYYSFCIGGIFGFINLSSIFDITVVLLTFMIPYFLKKQFCFIPIIKEKN